MGQQTLTVRKACAVYDRWLDDPRVEFYPEPRGMDIAFREATAPFAGKTASKYIGDCYLVAYARQCQATLVTFDDALRSLARKLGHSAVIPD
jgi:predicted nucleic acid-binding protein